MIWDCEACGSYVLQEPPGCHGSLERHETLGHHGSSEHHAIRDTEKEDGWWAEPQFQEAQ